MYNDTYIRWLLVVKDTLDISIIHYWINNRKYSI